MRLFGSDQTRIGLIIWWVQNGPSEVVESDIAPQTTSRSSSHKIDLIQLIWAIKS